MSFSRRTNIGQYIIYYLGPETSDLQDAQRLLRPNDTIDSIKQSKLLFQSPLPATTSIVPVDVGGGLPLSARNMQWGRFASPAAQRLGTEDALHSPSSESSEQSMLDDSAVNRRLMNFLGLREQDRRLRVPPTSEQYWNPSFSSGTRAVLGQIAFPLKQAQKAETKLRHTKIDGHLYNRLDTMQKAFVTTIPGMTRVLDTFKFEELDPIEYLWIRMLPSSSADLPAVLNEHLPPLEIRINVNKKSRTAELGMARLTKTHNELDLLLPRSTTDLRFIHRNYLYQTRERFDPSLLAFVKASNFDIWGSDRLKTPNSLQLSIPAQTIFRISKTSPSLMDKHHLIDYKFASLEHRSQVQLLPFLDTHKLFYSTIEAGRTGGRREELAITYGRSPQPEEDSSPRTRTAQFNKASKEKGSFGLSKASESSFSIDEGDTLGMKGARALVEAAEAMIGLVEDVEPDGRAATKMRWMIEDAKPHGKAAEKLRRTLPGTFKRLELSRLGEQDEGVE